MGRCQRFGVSHNDHNRRHIVSTRNVHVLYCRHHNQLVAMSNMRTVQPRGDHLHLFTKAIHLGQWMDSSKEFNHVNLIVILPEKFDSTCVVNLLGCEVSRHWISYKPFATELLPMSSKGRQQTLGCSFFSPQLPINWLDDGSNSMPSNKRTRVLSRLPGHDP